MERIIKKLAKPSVSRYYAESYGGGKIETDNVIADFCLNKCPHPEKACDGNCVEVKQVIAAAHRCYSKKVSEEEIANDKRKTPLGRYLKKLRKRRGEVRSFMARKIGMCETSLYNIERGKNPIPTDFAGRFLEAYKLSDKEFDEFFDSIEQTRRGEEQ